ncbi:MAG TPA: M48 family metallopeptidase [Opitutaceae bacterium]|nr:M48 family metallopeptidase [Opitutaceae bacterium]
MDFFEAQARAKKRTSRLVLLFILAVIGTIIAMYAAAVIGLDQARQHRAHRYSQYDYAAAPSSGAGFDWWQPRLFAEVALATLAIVGLGSLYKWSEFSAGGKAVAESVGGRRVDPSTRDLKERQLLNVVEEMAIASGVPVPAVYVLDEEPAINAFAAGLTTHDAVVTVTRGTLEKLNRDELQGVVGHEFSHILNGDMRLNLRIAAIIFGILVLGLVGRGILWSLRGTRVSSRGRGNSGGTVAVILVVGLALIVIGYVGYFFGRLIQAAVSRQREFLADASSVQFTRNPAGITGALKKIGGYALGSTMAHNQSAAIGHFFFAQAFGSGITGLWATHPPLADRIRAVEPTFDGKFFEPPEVVDVDRQSFVGAGLVPPRATAVPAGSPPPLTPATPMPAVAGSSRAATTAIAAIGSLTPAQIANAQLLLDATPPRLRSAAQTTAEARVLICGLLLDGSDEVRTRQREMIARLGADALHILDELQPDLQQIREEHRLPLLQLTLPALRLVPSTALQPFLAVLDDLIRADNQISPFEYALQRILTNTLNLSRAPRAAVVQYYSLNAVVPEIAVVLSVLAGASTSDSAVAPPAFAAGAAQIKLIESQLQFSATSATDLAAFDQALDKLASASLPIKQRTLVAAAHVVQYDGQVLITEFELLRAVAAALDIPMPPLAVVAS